MKKYLDWDECGPLMLLIAVITFITYICIDSAIKEPKRAAEAKQDAENICLVYPGSTAVYVMTNPERRTGKTYIPATYAWHCLKDGIVIDPYK